MAEYQDRHVILIIPTYNAGELWPRCIRGIEQQKLQPDDVWVVDSTSSDDTIKLASASGYHVHIIPTNSFDHGQTRQTMVDLLGTADILVFITQDCILQENAIQDIVTQFDDANVAAAYGRQLPHLHAGPISTHARLFNYPVDSCVKAMKDVPRLRLKTAFLSNSFAAYRRSALQAVGGFPNHTILSEDMYVAAKMLLAGWKIAYCAEAQAYHSHDYTHMQEFKRYFDIGVFHAKEPWIRKTFGQADGEGIKFVKSEMKYLWDTGYWYLMLSATIRTGLKYIGYKLGIRESCIPVSIKRKISMHPRFW